MSRLILFFSLLLVSCSDGRGKDVKKYDISEQFYRFSSQSDSRILCWWISQR